MTDYAVYVIVIETSAMFTTGTVTLVSNKNNNKYNYLRTVKYRRRSLNNLPAYILCNTNTIYFASER
jgi:hypothetical protein